MNIDFIYNTDFKLDNEDELSSWIQRFCDAEKFKIDSLVFAFFNDEELKELNIKYLDHNYYTDVISFDRSLNGVISGDIAISIDRVAENANEFSVTFEEEIRRVMVHGVLHFMGYKDETQEEQSTIRSMEDLALAMFHVKQ